MPRAAGTAVGRVSAGYGFTCGMTTVDRAYCWGDKTPGAVAGPI
jgi:hypothetical protein